MPPQYRRSTRGTDMGSDQLGNYNRGVEEQRLQFAPESTMGPDPYAGAVFEQLNNALQLPTQYANASDRVTRRAERDRNC